MRLYILLGWIAIASVAAAAAPVPKTNEKPKDDTAILGEWQTAKVEREGGKPAGPGVLTRKYTFKKDGKLDIDLGGDQVLTVDFALDPSGTPKSFDINITDGDKMHVPGIYELDGDTLKLCMEDLGNNLKRPTVMKAQGRVAVLTFKRILPKTSEPLSK